MMIKVQDERTGFVRESLRRARLLTPAIAAQLEVPWRSKGSVVQVVFFILTSVAMFAFYGLCQVTDLPGPGIVTGVLGIALAEYLIGARRWFGTGVEGALWLGGLFALISELPSSGRPESLLVIAAAFAIAGARVRNPLAGAAAACTLAFYAERRFDLGVVAALLLAAAAVLLLLREWRRPSTEFLFAVAAIALPIAGAFMAGPGWRQTTVVLYAVFGMGALALAIARRHHAILLAACASLMISAIDLGRMIDAPLEAKLAAGGVLLLAVAFAVSRALRGRTRGIVVTPAKLTHFDYEVEIVATLSHQPEAAAPTEPTAPGGGAFGGAGATGEF